MARTVYKLSGGWWTTTPLVLNRVLTSEVWGPTSCKWYVQYSTNIGVIVSRYTPQIGEWVANNFSATVPPSEASSLPLTWSPSNGESVYINYGATETYNIVTQYLLTGASDGNGYTNISANYYVDAGTRVGNIIATPHAHYKFDRWQDDVRSNPRSFTVNQDTTLTAYFVRNEWYVTATAGTGGSASGSGWGSPSKKVTLKATPNTGAGYSFVGWSLNGSIISGSATYDYYPSNDVTIQAVFTKDVWDAIPKCRNENGPPYDVCATCEPNGLGQCGVRNLTTGGGFSVIKVAAKKNDQIQFQATLLKPDQAAFYMWRSSHPNDIPDSTNNPVTITMPEHNFTYSAWFKYKYYNLKVTVEGGDFGDANIIVSGTPYKQINVWHHWNATIVAVPKDEPTSIGIFEGWFAKGYTPGDDPISTALELPLTYQGFDAQEIVAKFSEGIATDVTTAVEGEDGEAEDEGCEINITTPANGDGQYYIGKEIAFEIVPAVGFVLHQLQMKVDGESVSNLTVGATNLIKAEWGLPSTWKWGDELRFPLPDEIEVTAVFIYESFVIGYSKHEATPAGRGLVEAYVSEDNDVSDDDDPYDGESPITYGNYVLLVATPGGTDVAKGWFRATEDGLVPVVTGGMLTTEVTQNETFVAKFGNTIAVAGDSDGTAQVKLATEDTWDDTVDFVYGESVTIKAVPNETKYFSHWKNSSSETMIGWGVTVTFAPTDGETYTAVFRSEKKPCYIRLANSNEHQGDGALTLSVPAGNTITEITLNEYISGISSDLGVPRFQDPMQGLGTSEPTTTSAYFVTDDTCMVTLQCEVIKANARFVDWSQRGIEIIATQNGDRWRPEITLTPFSTDTVTDFFVTDHVEFVADYYEPGEQKIILRFGSGSNSTMGTLSLEPQGRIPEKNPVSGLIMEDVEFDAIALPANGYRFVGWYEDSECIFLLSESSRFTQVAGSSSKNSLYAAFVADTNAVYKWEGSNENKMAIWRSKRFVAARPVNLSSARVYADGYPATLMVHYASSPDSPTSVQNRAVISVGSQDSRRLPMLRPEKYMEIEIVTSATIQEISVSTSMTGILLTGKNT